MPSANNNSARRFGTAPVFSTAISTILGAILFLRFGYAVGTIGFMGSLLLIILGHLITVPTALAISELSTNTRVEGGGEYFIISRSFGLNVGFREEHIKRRGPEYFTDFSQMEDVLFVNASRAKEIVGKE